MAACKKAGEFPAPPGNYIIINTMFWCIWYFTGTEDKDYVSFPWPVWPMLGWGIGLAFEFAGAYLNTKPNSIEKEYQKLKNK